MPFLPHFWYKIGLNTTCGIFVGVSREFYCKLFTPEAYAALWVIENTTISLTQNFEDMRTHQNIYEKTIIAVAILLFSAISAFAQFTTSGTNVYLTNSSNRLGLGTTTPAAKLHVAGTNSIARISSSTGRGYLSFYSYNTTNVGYAGVYNGSTSMDIGTSSGNTSGRMQLVTQAIPRLSVAPNGYVGIGTTAPKSLFDVREYSNDTTAMFYNAAPNNDKTVVLGAQVTGTGANNAIAVKGVSITGPYSGIGGRFEGGLFSGDFRVGELYVESNSFHSLHAKGNGAEAGYFEASNAHGIVATSISSNPAHYAGMFYGNTYASGSYLSSDARLKQNVQAIQGALDKIKLLKPASYTFKSKEYEFLHLPEGQQLGLLAQDLEMVYPELVQEVSADRNHNESEGEGEHTPHTASDRDEFKFKAVNYNGLVPVLIAGMQEQQRDIEAKDKQINALEERISRLERLVNSLVDNRTGNAIEKVIEKNTTDNKVLGNRPNPFQNATTVDFELALTVRQATLQVFNGAGQQVKQMALEARGKSSVEVALLGLPAGVYVCTIVADGKALTSLKMTLLGLD